MGNSFNETLSISISDEEVPELLEELKAKSSLSTSKLIKLILKQQIPILLDDGNSLLELIDSTEES